MNPENNSLEKRLNLADTEITLLESNLLPATIIGGFAAISLIPIGALTGELFGQKELGAIMGFSVALSAGLYWIKNVGRWFYEPICRKYNVTSDQWEKFYINKLHRARCDEPTFL
jgi:hypothetical protein